MSLQAMCAALKADLPTLEKFVLVALANYADEEGKCWPSVGRLVKDTGISRRTVFRKLTELERRGVIRRENRHRDNLKISTVYHITLGNLEVREPHQGSVRDAPGSVRDAPGSVRDAPGVVSELHLEPVSLEPVNEPVNEHSSSKPAKGKPPATRASVPDGFNEFWMNYPRKVGKKAAMKAYAKARQEASEQDLLAGVKALIDAKPWEDNLRFCPHPSTWLNEGRWADSAINGEAPEVGPPEDLTADEKVDWWRKHIAAQ